VCDSARYLAENPRGDWTYCMSGRNSAGYLTLERAAQKCPVERLSASGLAASSDPKCKAFATSRRADHRNARTGHRILMRHWPKVARGANAANSLVVGEHDEETLRAAITDRMGQGEKEQEVWPQWWRRGQSPT